MENGDWATPRKLESLSTEKDDWYPTIAQNGNLYFTNGTLYMSKSENGTYTSKIQVDIPMDGVDIRDPCISPNDDYLIFSASASSNDQNSDLYVSFKDENGQWSQAQELDSNINTDAWEIAPYISPDEQFLFFSRRDHWQQATFSNTYWVSLEVIESLRDGSR